MRINRDTSWFTDLLLSESDSGYKAAAERKELLGETERHKKLSAVIAAVSMGLVGFGFAAAAQLVQQTRPIAQETKIELIERIETLRDLNTALSETNRSLQLRNRRLEDLVLPDLDGKLASSLKTAKRFGGYSETRGNGLQIILTEVSTDGGTNPSDYVLDTDLQIIANGLWESGAKAIEINGIRLTAATSIRIAGATVLIDFQPVLSPFVIKAIGPYSMRQDFNESDANVWLADLTTNYPVEGSVQWRKNLSVASGTMPTVKYSEEMDS
ncbi:MAG: hypothetical protein RIS75_854 [Actinomycetota bacterium]